MSKIDIMKFYEAAVKQKKFNLSFWKELKEISTQEELKSFIEKNVQPISKKMGYNFSTKELLDYEKQMAKKITEKQLEAVSGGVDVKNLALGGIVSLMALGAGVIASTSSTSAQLNIEAIEGSEQRISDEVDKEIPISKKEAAKQEDKKKTPKKAAEVRVSAEEKKEEVKPQEETRVRSVLDEEKEVSSDTESSDTEDLELTKAATEVDPAKSTETRQLTDEQKLYVYEALNLQEAYVLLQSGVIENIRICGNIVEIETVDGVRRYTADKGDDFIELLYMLFPSNEGNLTPNGRGNRLHFSTPREISPELMAKFCAILNDYRSGKILNEEKEIDEIKKLLDNNDTTYIKAKKNQKMIFTNAVTQLLHKYNIIGNVGKYESGINFQNAQIRLYGLFILALKGAVDLENAEGSVYPKYLTERILMSYMIKTLDTKEQVKELYQQIARKLSQNESSKETTKEDKKAEIAEKIVKAKSRMTNLNEILKAAEVQELSPYKSEPQSNASAFQIGKVDKDGNVQIETGTLADCADITLRHVLNLLVYSNAQNWDVVLPKKEDFDRLNGQLKEIINAINNKGKKDKVKVKFYDLKDRIQMFFLYQSGFVKGRDKEDDRQYRSSNGADDVTVLARTLWEYAICNMDKESFSKEPNKDKGYYEIVYNKRNIELYSGYINQLKLMWNIAHALGLGTDTVGEETKLALAKESIKNLETNLAEQDKSPTEKQAKAGFPEIFKGTLFMVFSLFYQGTELEINPTECKYEKIDGNAEVTGIVNVEVTKGEQKLSFSINQESMHAEVDHNPVSFDIIKYVYGEGEEYERKQEELKIIMYKLNNDIELTKDQEKLKVEFFKKRDEKFESIKDDFATLLLRSFTKNDEENGNKVQIPTGFYGAYSGEELSEDDDFRDTEIFKKYKALRAFKALQNEERNDWRIKKLITSEVMDGAGKIKVKQIINEKDGIQKITQVTLAHILYESYLKPNREKFSDDYLYEVVYPVLFGEIREIYSTKDHIPESKITNFDVIKTSKEGNEVILFIKNIPEDGNLNIPAKIYDNDGKEYKVVVICKAEGAGLKVVSFVGDFGDLSIASQTFSSCKNLQTVNFTGKIKSLAIGKGAFARCTALTTFEISEGVTSLLIGEFAFAFCENLQTVNFTEKVTSLEIGENAFCYCKALTAFTIPEGVTSLTIGYLAFEDCEALTVFKIPEGVTSLSIENRAFSGCTAFTTFEIPEGVTSLTIGQSAFSGCNALTTFEISEGVTSLTIGKRAFENCIALTTFEIPKSITSLAIGESAFEYCTTLTTFTIPKGVTSLSIGKMAFSDCTALTAFTIPEGVTSLSIEKSAFLDCEALATFKIPEGVTSLTIGQSAFSGCKALTAFTIPEGVTSLTIGQSAFIFCVNLQTVNFTGKVTSLAIGQSAFEGCETLATFTIPEGVTSLVIRNQAFADCKALTAFTIPEGVTSLSIENRAFWYDKALKAITIPYSVKSIELGSDMLALSSVKKLLIPKHLEGKIPKDFDGKEKIIFYSYDVKNKELTFTYVRSPYDKLDSESLKQVARAVGVSDISEIQAIQAINSYGEVIEIKLAEDLQKEFSKSEDVPGKLLRHTE